MKKKEKSNPAEVSIQNSTLTGISYDAASCEAITAIARASEAHGLALQELARVFSGKGISIEALIKIGEA